MNALERAKHLIKAANEADERDDYVATVREAHALAAIAQAEQLKRIADALYRKGEEVVSLMDMIEIIYDDYCAASER